MSVIFRPLADKSVKPVHFLKTPMSLIYLQPDMSRDSRVSHCAILSIMFCLMVHCLRCSSDKLVSAGSTVSKNSIETLCTKLRSSDLRRVHFAMSSPMCITKSYARSAPIGPYVTIHLQVHYRLCLRYSTSFGCRFQPLLRCSSLLKV